MTTVDAKTPGFIGEPGKGESEKFCGNEIAQAMPLGQLRY
jgi:hypothetical protein